MVNGPAPGYTPGMRMERVALAVLTAFSSGCISVRERERHRTAADAVPGAGALQRASTGEVEVRSFVYKPRLFPLEDFLKRFSRGDFKRAFRRANLRYNPSNADDKALRALLAHGIAPAYVEATNTGKESVDLSGLRLSLLDSSTQLEPIPNEGLPKAFEDFNPKAAAANVYNTGAAVVGCAAMLSMLAVGVVAGGDPLGGAGVLAELGSNLDGEVYNALKMTTEVDYDGLLWKPVVLAPGEKARGLVFFKAGAADWTNLRLGAPQGSPEPVK